MFSFLGEWIALVVWLIQQGNRSLQGVLVEWPVRPALAVIPSRQCCVSVSAVRGLANGPPWDSHSRWPWPLDTSLLFGAVIDCPRRSLRS